MLTTAETAEILGVSPASVRVWLSEEGHPRFPNAKRFGHVWQIPESDLANLPKGRKRGRPKKETTKKAKQGALFFAGRVTSNDVTDATDDATEKKKAAKKKGARAK